MYDVVFEAVDEMGGVYVKLLQFISLRADLIPDPAKMRFLTFYDHVDPEKMNVSEILTRELGPAKLSSFTSVETEPFASGTFGQVYRATMTDGKQAVIKIKRSRLAEKLFADFLIIRFLGFMFDLFYEQSFVNIPRLVREFRDITYRELDYRQEVENALYLYNNYRNHKTLFIPYTYIELSTDNVIVQEYVGGIPVTDLLRMRSGGADIRTWLMAHYRTDLHFLIKRISYDCMWQIFSLDKFFADPHPGNIKILPDNRYAFIDFGIVEPSPPNKRDYFRVIRQLSRGAEHINNSELGEELLSIGSHHLFKCLTTYDRIFSDNETSLKRAVLERYGELIESWREQLRQLELGQMENYTKVWLDLFLMGEQFRMRMPKGLFAGLRASALISSFTRYLDPDFHTMQAIYTDITNDIDERNLLNLEDVEHRSIGIEQATETVSDWFAGLAESDLMLYRDVGRLNV